MTLTRTDRATTPWASGRFDAGSGEPRLLFGRTFEDPAIELDLFPVDGEILCIASAGDTAARPGRGGPLCHRRGHQPGAARRGATPPRRSRPS